MDDLISRKAAIKDAESWVAVDEYEKHLQKNVIEWLKEFPSAELGTNLAEVGTDCISRHVYEQCAWERNIAIEQLTELGYGLGEKIRTEKDCISRQAAIDYFVINVGFHDEDGYPIEDTDELRKIWTEYFDGIPSAEPKRGRWLYCEDTTADCVDGYRCDQCGFFVPWDYQHKSIDYIKDYNFCPNCGSYNGGKNEI